MSSYRICRFIVTKLVLASAIYCETSDDSKKSLLVNLQEYFEFIE
jgi:hypothetical protein